MKYTTRADHFVRLGIAEIVAGKLLFLPEHQDKQTMLRSVFFWNGNKKPDKMHLPGEVRS